MNQNNKYNIRTNILYESSQVIDIPALLPAINDPWYNQSLSIVNDCVIRLGVFEGEFHWHKHDAEDEFFLVLEGKLFLDLEDKTLELFPWQGYTVLRGINHRTRALNKAIVLMVEKRTVNATGN